MIKFDRRIAALALIAAGASPTAACAKQPGGDTRQLTPTTEAQATIPGSVRTSNGGRTAVGWSFQQFKQRREQKVMAADADQDGRVSRAEFVEAMTNGKGDPGKRFAHLDRNGDGFIDLQEIDFAAGKRFRRLDNDSDGRLTHRERKAGHASANIRSAASADDAAE